MVSHRGFLHAQLICRVGNSYKLRVWLLAALFGMLLLLPLRAGAQATITVRLSQVVTAPWDKACDAVITRGCIKGWRIYDALADKSGVGTVLFDIPVVTPFTGTVTASGSGPYPSTNGMIGATTVGIDALGDEVESLIVYASAVAPPNPPQVNSVIITINLSAGGGQ